MGKVHEQMLLPDCAFVPYLASALPGKHLTWQAPYLKTGCLRDSSQGRRSFPPQSSSDVSFSGTRLLSQL